MDQTPEIEWKGSVVFSRGATREADLRLTAQRSGRPYFCTVEVVYNGAVNTATFPITPRVGKGLHSEEKEIRSKIVDAMATWREPWRSLAATPEKLTINFS